VSEVKVYCDGACAGNPGPGGWGAVLIVNRRRKEISGGEQETTNNRMELTAAIEALRSLPDGSDVNMFTDSSYLLNGATAWLKGWKERGWKRKEGPLLNVDLWKLLDVELQRHNICWQWVKGHSGNTYNERADQLATSAIPWKS